MNDKNIPTPYASHAPVTATTGDNGESGHCDEVADTHQQWVLAQADISEEILDENRDRGRHSVPLHGTEKTIDVLPDVFSPEIFHGHELFTPTLFEELDDYKKRHNGVTPSLLEIGAGSGITGLSLYKTGRVAPVTLTDISDAAVRNCRHNIELLQCGSQCMALESDVYDALSPGTKYDVIYWNHPWIEKPEDFRHKDLLQYGLYDPGYSALRRFIVGLSQHLSDDGVGYLGFGNFGDEKELREICADANVELSEVKRSVGDEGGEVEFVLYKLTPCRDV